MERELIKPSRKLTKRSLRRGRSPGRLLCLSAFCLSAAGVALAGPEPYQTPANHRIEQTVNRRWTFNYFPAENADSKGCQAPDFDDSTWPAIGIPHTWQTYETTGKLHPFNHDAHEKDDPYWWYGWGWYRKHFSIGTEERGRRVYVEFDGVQKYCKIWLNGQFVGEHKGGYTGFYFDLTSKIHFGGDNVLAVAVNARQDDPFKIPPMSAGNWTPYGGIYRDVRIVIKDSLHIPFQGAYQHEGGTFVTTPEVSNDSGVAEVKTWVRNDDAAPKECELRTTIADADGNPLQVLTAQKTVQPGELAEFDQRSAPIAHPRLWSPETPYVYKVFSDVYDSNGAVDHFESPLGFRWFKWDYADNRLILNGKKVIIHGTNRHQEWPWLGDATPKWLQLRDMRDIRHGLNDNFMRTAHYPNDPCIYDFNDHHGIITIEEQPNDKRQEFSQDVQVQVLRETIRRDRNHPSIFFWSMGNETTDAVDSKYAVQEDTTRIIYARQIYNDSAGKFVTLTDKQLALESLLRCTVRGWYNSDVRNLEPKSSQQAGNEEWQHDQAVAYFISHNKGRAADDLANLNTWLYEDHGCDRKYANEPLNFVNPKGWVDCWRAPKFMYYLWQAWYSTQPMVFVHPEFWRPQYLGQKKEIVVDSNCETVELQVNGRRIGVLKPSLAQANVVRFENVPVEQGVLSAIGTQGGTRVTNTVVLAGAPARLVLTAEPDSLQAGRDSVGIIHVDIVDEAGNHVYGATNTLRWSVSGPATLVGAPVYQTDIAQQQSNEGTMYIDAPAFNIIRSSGEPGEITVRAQSPGLVSAEVSVTASPAPENAVSAIVQPPLPQTPRRPVAQENESGTDNAVVVREMKEVSDDFSFTPASRETYAREMDLYFHKKNPGLDFTGPEYRVVLSVFARLLDNNHGSLVRDDFDFIAGLYNSCRQITRQIDPLKLPGPFKQSLREYYARLMIEHGEARNSVAETRWLKSLPDGKLVVADVNSGAPRERGVIYTDKSDLAKIVALALPEFKTFDTARQALALEAVCTINPNVNRRIIKSGGERVAGVRQKTLETVTYEVAKGRPILIPSANDLVSVSHNLENTAQN
jgi:beta-galactosidase